MNDPSLQEWARDTFARRDEVLTRTEFTSRAAALAEAQRAALEHFEERVNSLEDWKSNLMGRAVAFTVLGAILIAVSASVITRLIFPGG